MEFLDKYFATTIYPDFIKSNYQQIVADFVTPGGYDLGNIDGASAKVYVTKDKGQGSTKYLVENCYHRESYIGNATNICFEKNGQFFSVSERSFVSFDSITDELFGPVETFSGFTIDSEGQAYTLDEGSSQIAYEAGCNAIDMISSKTLVKTIEPVSVKQ
ncbi:MAG: hypothetical protein IJW32_01915 [Clostridia bacterium]|nr:hypothetical protein [Clostridia bacterium]